MVTVYNDHLRRQGAFRPTLQDIKISFQEHLKKMVKESNLPPLMIHHHPIWLSTSENDVFDLGYDSNWKRLEAFTDESLMELIKKRMARGSMLRSCLMSYSERNWLKTEREKEILKMETERLRHEEVSN